MRIQCTLCANDYDNSLHFPRILIHCGHTLCESCLKAKLSNEDSFNCPECDEAITIAAQINKQDGVMMEYINSHFPKNLALLNILNVHTKTVKSSKQQQINEENNSKNENANIIVVKVLKNSQRQTLNTSSGTTNGCNNQDSNTTIGGSGTDQSLHLHFKSTMDQRSKQIDSDSDEITQEDADDQDEFDSAPLTPSRKIFVDSIDDQKSFQFGAANFSSGNGISLNTHSNSHINNSNNNSDDSSLHQYAKSTSGCNSCATHRKKIKAFCQTCQILLCIDCIVLTDHHKAHEIIATSKAYIQEKQLLSQQAEETKIIRDQLVNLQHTIDSQQSSLVQTANERRQAVSELYHWIRQQIVNRETMVKTNISQTLENEQLRLKVILGNIRTQLRDIDKCSSDYKQALKEDENMFLSKLKKRQARNRKALQEVQNVDFPKVFPDFVEKDELQKVSKLIMNKKGSKLSSNKENIQKPVSSSVINSLHQTANLSLTMSTSLKAQVRSNKKQINSHHFSSTITQSSSVNQPIPHPKINKINLLSPSSQQAMPYPSVANATHRSKSRDNRVISNQSNDPSQVCVFKSQNLIRKSPENLKVNSHDLSLALGIFSASKMDKAKQDQVSKASDFQESLVQVTHQADLSLSPQYRFNTKDIMDSLDNHNHANDNLDMLMHLVPGSNQEVFQESTTLDSRSTNKDSKHKQESVQKRRDSLNETSRNKSIKQGQYYHKQSVQINLNNSSLNNSQHQMFGSKIKQKKGTVPAIKTSSTSQLTQINFTSNRKADQDLNKDLENHNFNTLSNQIAHNLIDIEDKRDNLLGLSQTQNLRDLLSHTKNQSSLCSQREGFSQTQKLNQANGSLSSSRQVQDMKSYYRYGGPTNGSYNSHLNQSISKRPQNLGGMPNLLSQSISTRPPQLSINGSSQKKAQIPYGRSNQMSSEKAYSNGKYVPASSSIVHSHGYSNSLSKHTGTLLQSAVATAQAESNYEDLLPQPVRLFQDPTIGLGSTQRMRETKKADDYHAQQQQRIQLNQRQASNAHNDRTSDFEGFLDENEFDENNCSNIQKATFSNFTASQEFMNEYYPQSQSSQALLIKSSSSAIQPKNIMRVDLQHLSDSKHPLLVKQQRSMPTSGLHNNSISTSASIKAQTRGKHGQAIDSRDKGRNQNILPSYESSTYQGRSLAQNHLNSKNSDIPQRGQIPIHKIEASRLIDQNCEFYGDDLLNQLLQKTESYLYAISGYQESPLNSIEKYDAQRGIWTEIQGAINIPRTKFQAVPVNSLTDENEQQTQVYILGGKKFDGSRTDTIELFDPQTGSVKLINQKLPKGRSGFAAINIGNQILVVGGNDGKVLNKVDSLDLHTMQWLQLPNLQVARDELSVCLGPDMKIYAVGGYGSPEKQAWIDFIVFSVCLNSAERYDPMTGKWEMLPPMNECRRSLALVALPDGVYAIGGYDGQNYLSSVEKFDCQRNQWIQVTPMNSERCTLSAVASPDCQYIYSVGGFNGKPSSIVERYSVLTNMWEFVTPLKRPRFMHSACFLQFKHTKSDMDPQDLMSHNNILSSPLSSQNNLDYNHKQPKYR